jgi:hypothetical protein
MRVGAAETEAADPGPAYAVARLPVAQPGVHGEGAVGEIDPRVRLAEVQARWYLLVF